MKKETVLILGGAGFVGSRIAHHFLSKNIDIVVVDGLFPRTGGKRKNLQALNLSENTVFKPIQEVKDLAHLIESANVVIDAMAWTAHIEALEDPFYDLALNTSAHLYFLDYIKQRQLKARMIYLSSRGVYGNSKADHIDEDSPLSPEDIQGIHKVATENYYRLYTKTAGIDVSCVRFSNCFGPHQPTEGRDIGLIGGFIKSCLKNEPIEIYGNNRKRNIISADYVADAVYRLYRHSDQLKGYNAFNLSGVDVKISDLVAMICEITKQGSYSVKPLPEKIEAIDIGNTSFLDNKLRLMLDLPPHPAIADSLNDAINFFKKELLL